MSFSENLIRLQNEHCETNYRLAKELGVHATTIQNWRDGKMPQLAYLERLAQHYKTSIDDILR